MLPAYEGPKCAFSFKWPLVWSIAIHICLIPSTSGVDEELGSYVCEVQTIFHTGKSWKLGILFLTLWHSALACGLCLHVPQLSLPIWCKCCTSCLESQRKLTMNRCLLRISIGGGESRAFSSAWLLISSLPSSSEGLLCQVKHFGWQLCSLALWIYHPTFSRPAVFLLDDTFIALWESLVCGVLLFSCCFHHFLFVFDFWPFDYNVSEYIFLWIEPLKIFVLHALGWLLILPGIEEFSASFIWEIHLIFKSSLTTNILMLTLLMMSNKSCSFSSHFPFSLFTACF